MEKKKIHKKIHIYYDLSGNHPQWKFGVGDINEKPKIYKRWPAPSADEDDIAEEKEKNKAILKIDDKGWKTIMAEFNKKSTVQMIWNGSKNFTIIMFENQEMEMGPSALVDALMEPALKFENRFSENKKKFLDALEEVEKYLSDEDKNKLNEIREVLDQYIKESEEQGGGRRRKSHRKSKKKSNSHKSAKKSRKSRKGRKSRRKTAKKSRKNRRRRRR